jgi:nucleoside-diphosphate-sugar epimerase
LGSRICTTLSERGWRVVGLARSPSPESTTSVQYDIAAPIDEALRGLLRSADVLVHAAYDFSVTSQADIWRVNVQGTRNLLHEARRANVRRIVVLSSMSAYEGTAQLYGRAKLAIEKDALAAGGCAIRPGVVIGSNPGGMAGALRKLALLPNSIGHCYQQGMQYEYANRSYSYFLCPTAGTCFYHQLIAFFIKGDVKCTGHAQYVTP